MLDQGWTVGEAFVWGMAAATVGWIVLAVVSALALGLMIRRSDQAAALDEHALRAQQDELEEAARLARAAAGEAEAVPFQSGTRFRPVGDGDLDVLPVARRR